MTTAELYSTLESDPQRRQFSDEVEKAQDALFRNPDDHAAIQATLNDWLGVWQPCLFGKIASRQGLLRFCILTEHDLLQSDTHIKAKIQAERQAWHADAFEGHASGFVLLAISRRLATARPNAALESLACQLASFHLNDQPRVVADTIRMDSIYLEKPGFKRKTWKWLVGINFFGSQGDGRWWQDHRHSGRHRVDPDPSAPSPKFRLDCVGGHRDDYRHRSSRSPVGALMLDGDHVHPVPLEHRPEGFEPPGPFRSNGFQVR